MCQNQTRLLQQGVKFLFFSYFFGDIPMYFLLSFQENILQLYFSYFLVHCVQRTKIFAPVSKKT